MARVTIAEVQEIISYDSSITNIQPFIDAANLMVTAVCTSTLLSDSLLKEIERWLSAHFVAIRDPKLVSQSIGGASDSYETNKTDFGLKLTRYGQQAIALDISGALNAIAKGAKSVAFKKIEPDDLP